MLTLFAVNSCNMSSEIDQMLYRDLKDGKKYDGLIPQSNCESVDLGDGMTDYTVEKMSEWVRLHAGHMAKVAPTLKATTLQGTCENVHWFTYDHFAYKADLDEQFLRSPACAWHNRFDGLDCKSYSIIASSIFLNLGITHYIRRIRQDAYEPDLWTHVYVIVPVDQKTGDLSKGYYFVDGTVPFDTEPEYLEKSDKIMKHTGLAGAQPQGLNGDFTMADLKNLFNGGWSLNCIGGTYDTNDFNASMAVIVPFMDDCIYGINEAVRANSPEVMDKINRMLINVQQIKDHSLATSKHNWNSNCSKSATGNYKDLGLFYYNICFNAFKAWLEKYFTVTWVDAKVSSHTFEPEIRNASNKGFKKYEFGRDDLMVKKLASITLKPGQQDIVRFELTKYSADSKSYTGTFDSIKALAELVKPLVTIGAAVIGGSKGGSNTGTVTSDGTYDETDPNNAKGSPTTTSNTGKIVGAALLLGGIAYFTLAPDKPGLKGPAKKSSSSTKKTKV